LFALHKARSQSNRKAANFEQLKIQKGTNQLVTFFFLYLSEHNRNLLVNINFLRKEYDCMFEIKDLTQQGK
jgi:hypothetical protein